MQIQQIYTFSHLRNFSYLLINSTQEALCIDPFDADQIISLIESEGLTLKAIINTHEHFDHYCGNAGLISEFNCEVWAHENAKGKIPGVTRYLKASEEINFGENSYLKVMDTPGHTFAHLCLLAVKEQRPYAVFTGDTLFNAGVGNCHNGGDPEVLYETISQQFQGLADDVWVYPGHDYLENNLKFTLNCEPDNLMAKEILESRSDMIDEQKDQDFLVTSMKVEREVNTFLRLESEGLRKELLSNSSLALDQTGLTNKQVFLTLRSLRNKW